MTSIGSLSSRVSLYMAVNKGAEMDSRQIAEKFNVKIDSVNTLLKPAVDMGYLNVERRPQPPRSGIINVYSSGPQIERLRVSA